MGARATALVFDLVSRADTSGLNRFAAGADRATAANDRLVASSGRVEKSTGYLGAGLAKSAVKIGAAFGAFELAKRAIDIGKEAAAYQRTMTLIQTQAGASADEVKKFSTALLGISATTGTAPEALATSLYHIYSTGVRGAKALDAVKIAAEGAKIGNANLEETTNALTSTIVSGIKGAQDMSQAMGALNVIVGAGDMKLSDLNEALAGGILSSARSFGVTLGQVGAALAVLGDNNVRGAESATQLRVGFMALAQPVKGGAAALASVGLEAKTLRDDLSRGGLTTALDDLTNHMTQAGITGNKVGGFITEAFGRKAGIGLTILVEQADRYHIKLNEIAMGAASFGAAWDATQKTTSFAFSRIGAEVDAAGIAVAMKLMPPITAAASAIGSELPAAFHTVTSIIGPFASVVGTVFSGAWKVAGAVLGAAASALGVIGSGLVEIKDPLTIIGTLALSVWAGFKGAALVSSLLTTVGIALKGAALNMLDFGASASATAATFLGSSSVIAGAADATAADVTVAGRLASTGWAGVLGPIAGVAIGIAALVSMFHKSSGASKEATDAAKAYTDALNSEHGQQGTSITDAIQKQLTSNDVPATLDRLNKALGATKFTGTQFVTAIVQAGKPLDELRAKLQAVIKAGTTQGVETVGATDIVKSVTRVTPAAQAATKALNDLNAQYDGLNAATRTDLLNTKAFAGASSSIDKVSQSTEVGTTLAKQYAEMSGIVVDKNGIAAISAEDLSKAVTTVGDAYDKATGTGNEFLAALDTFSKSAGTAADRAAIIGATLKANAGDALSFGATINAAATATEQLGTGITSAAKTGNQSTHEFLASIVNLSKGTINFSDTAAAPLISNLQSIQSSALAAAQGTYQHNLATEGGAQAALDAVNSYKGVERSLERQFESLGLTSGQAKTLTEKYLGVPDKVKTLITQEGADPVLNVLNGIGQQLSYLTGQPWTSTVALNDQVSPGVQHILDELNSIPSNRSVTVTTYNQLAATPGTQQNTDAKNKYNSFHSAAGSASWTRDGKLPPGFSTVGERGWELVKTDRAGRSEVFSHAQSRAMTGLPAVLPGFASGTKKTYQVGHTTYTSALAAQNAVARADAAKVSATTSALAALHGVVVDAAASFDQVRTAAAALVAAARAQGASAQLLSYAGKAQAMLSSRAQLRDAVRARLGTAPSVPTAYDNLTTAKNAYDSSFTTVRDAVGAFNATAAGASVYTDQPSGSAAAFLTNLTATATKASQFAGLLKTLLKEGVPRSIVEQLAAAGPSAYDTAKALSVATPAQILAIQGQSNILATAAASAGTTVANGYYAAGVASAQGIVNGLLSQQSALNKAIAAIGDGMIKTLKGKLGIHSPSKEGYFIGTMFGEGARLGIRARHDAVEKEAATMGGKIIGGASGPVNTRPSSGNGGAEYHRHYHIEHMDPEAYITAVERRERMWSN